MPDAKDLRDAIAHLDEYATDGDKLKHRSLLEHGMIQVGTDAMVRAISKLTFAAPPAQRCCSHERLNAAIAQGDVRIIPRTH